MDAATKNCGRMAHRRVQHATLLDFDSKGPTFKQGQAGRQKHRNSKTDRRSLRAVLDLKKLHEKTLWIDCDVLRADGGTRTASITGAWLATRIAITGLLEQGKIDEDPILDHLAAISVGVDNDHCLLDLDYPEDRDATVDANVVMTGSGQYVEVQSSGEEATFSRPQMNELLDLAEKGIGELVALQKSHL